MKKLLSIAALLFIGYKVFGSLFGLGGPGLPSEISPVRSLPLAERTNVLLFTGTEWCPACKVLERNVIDTDPWGNFSRNEVVFTIYDVPRDPRGISGPMATALQRYQVSSFPTMLVVDRQGNLISQRVGVAGNVEDYKRWIRDS